MKHRQSETPAHPEPVKDPAQVTRREFLGSAALAAVAASIPSLSQAASLGDSGAGGEVLGPGPVGMTLSVNSTVRTFRAEPRVTLLDALREHCGLTGSKKGCDHGQCGACTVLVDGRRVNSCLTLAVAAEGKEITTIEGLAQGTRLHPMQTAFIEHDAFQCGYCTPGQIVSAVGMQKEPWGGEDHELREGMSGNLCRCGAYDNILAAVKSGRGRA